MSWKTWASGDRLLAADLNGNFRQDGVLVSGAQGAATLTTGAVTQPLDTVLDGDAAYVDLAGNEFIAVVAGLYRLTFMMRTTVALVGTTTLHVRAYIAGGASIDALSGIVTVPSSIAAVINRTGVVALTAGQKVGIDCSAGTGVTAGKVKIDSALFERVLGSW